MRVLVCGSRHFNDWDLLKKTLEEIAGIETVIHGGARGADTMAENFAKLKGFEYFCYAADWEKYGKRAGPIRNYQMLKEGKPDLVVAFTAPNSKGTRHMVELSKKAGIEVKEIQI